MLAGATGIDLALLVIAADEGIMPQTEEHLAIVELLGIGRGVPVITKRDLVDDDWLALVRADVIARLERSPVRWAAPVAVSALAGSGLDELRDVLRATAQQLTERPSDDLYRLPIDRVFAVAGAGTVVTGSTWSGTLAVGDSVRLLPLDRDVRVRSIEIHGRPATQALPGRRTALALVGVDKGELTRGDVAVAGEGWRATTRIDAAVSLLTPTAAGSARAGRGGGAGGIGARKPLTNRTRVRVHLGTAEVLARVSGAVNIPPGGSGTVRLVLEQPLVARGGDRFVLRSFSPVTTIGGGVVLDPFSPTSSRQSRVLGAGGKPADRVVAWTEATGLLGIRIAELPVRLGVTPASVSAVIDEAGKGILACGDWLVTRAAATGEISRLAERIRAHHRGHALEPGLSLQALRASLEPVPAVVVDQVLALGARKGAFEIDGAVARLPGWRPSLDAGANSATAQLARRLADARWQVPTIAELEREFPGANIRALLAHLAREGGVEQVDQERFAATAALAEFRELLESALRELGAATPADLRDRFGLTRKFLIPLLEWADRRGITRRQGDARVLVRLTA